MKKYVFISFVSLFICAQFMMAQEGRTKKMIRSEYMEFLKEEGFSPTIDEDGDIKFKKEGSTYYIDIYDEKSPQYVVVSAPGFSIGGENGYDKAKAIIAANEANKLKRTVKLMVFDKYLAIRVEMPFTDTESFKGVFYKIMSYLNWGKESFIEEYNNL